LIGVAVPAAAAPAAGLTDPTGDPATSEVTPAPVSLRPFADIVEFDAALSGSTVELRVRVAADGPPPTSFLAGIGVDTTPGDMYRQYDVAIEHVGGSTDYVVSAYRSLGFICRGVATFDGASTYTARFDASCVGSPTVMRLSVAQSAPAPQATVDRGAAEPEPRELRPRDHAALPLRDRRDRVVVDELPSHGDV